MFEEESVKLSKINSAGLINIRINRIFNDALLHSREGRFSQWNSDLDCLWRELAGDVEENSEVEKDYQKIELDIKTIGVKDWTEITGFELPTESKKKLKDEQYALLQRKEIFLRRLQNKQGKGTAYKDGSEDDFD